MKKIRRIAVCVSVLCLAWALTACKADSVKEEPVPVPVPAKSRFAKIQPGWAEVAVKAAIGAPTEERAYTEKGSLFSPDKNLVEARYKGEGYLVYVASGEGESRSVSLTRIVYNPEESGYADKTLHPDGPHNIEPEKKPKRRPRKPRQTPAEPAAPVVDTKNDPLKGL